MAKLSVAIDRNAILALRQRIRFEDGRPYDARCSKIAEALQAQFGWQHCWNQLADGRILDATADQFESRWLGDIIVLEPADPHAKAYQPAPPGWTFTLSEQEAGVELLAVQDGRGEHHVRMSCANWMVAARARRVRAFLNQSMASGNLDCLLTVYEGQHATAVRGKPWMSSEYAAIL